MVRSFNVVCPFCEDMYPVPDNIDEIHRCQCGAVYKIAWRSDMEGAVDELMRSFLEGGDPPKNRSENNILCHAVVYEDIQNLMRMKMEYEAVKYIRQIQSFDQNYPQKVGLVWLGNYEGRHLRS
ncbi:MAG: hypothetical protein V3R28_02590 [Desulfatiglandales bacterium]